MDVSINVTWGEDLSLNVDVRECTLREAQDMLGSVCNELLRTNLALTMQAEDGPAAYSNGDSPPACE